MKIAATVIAYQAAAYISDLLKSLSDTKQVDYLVIGIDPKTNDDTRVVIEQWSEKSGIQAIIETGLDPMEDNQGFAVARNYLMRYVPTDTDWVIWLDADDVLGSDLPLHEYLDRMGPEVGFVWLPYLYHRNEWGDVDTLFMRERILRFANGPLWKGRVHEWCELRQPAKSHMEWDAQGNVKDAQVWVEHKNAENKPAGLQPDRNFRLLYKTLEEDPNDHRAVLYLAHQLFGALRWSEAAQRYEQFAQMRSAGDVPDEKYQSLIWAARAQRNAGNLSAAMRNATTAQVMMPQYQDAYIEMSHTLAMQKQWKRAITYHEDGLHKQRLNTILIHNPLDYDLNPWLIVHTCYFQSGNYAKALEAVTKALEYRPNDPELRFRGAYYKSAWDRAKAVEASLFMARHLLNTNEPLKARAILKALPAGSDEETAQVAGARAEVEERLAHLKDDVAYENFYFSEQPEVIENTPEHVAAVPHNYPRMKWAADQLVKLGVKKVLEVGVGNAISSLYFASRGLQVVGIDIDPKRVKDANFAAVKARLLKTRAAPEHTTPKINYHRHTPPCTAHKVECATDCAQDHQCSKIEHLHEAWNKKCQLCGPVLRLPKLARSSKVQFHWAKPGVIPEFVRKLGPFDAVIACEVIEHVEDHIALLELLESANRRYVPRHPKGKPWHVKEWVLAPGPKVPIVLLTTPDGAWRGGQALNPSHVQAWSLSEMETMLHRRGWLEQAHLIAHPAGEQPNLGLVYRTNMDFRDKPNVSIYCGPGLEPWTPGQVDREGLGGSETAVVEVAKNIALNGYRVIVWAEAEGIWDGVRYRKWRKWSPQRPCWFFISWRHPEVYSQHVLANIKALWLHDVDACGDHSAHKSGIPHSDGITADNIRQVDIVYGLSRWHMQHLIEMYPFLQEYKCRMEAHTHSKPHCRVMSLPDQVTENVPTAPIIQECTKVEHEHASWKCRYELAIIGNGIDPGRFAGQEERNTKRILYTSSPDRGLERVLEYWPAIRKWEPTAELHIYYGWENYDRLGGPGEFKARIMAAAQQEGITWHGRIGQRELAREMMRSGTLFYPGPHPFEETFCISAIEAQAAGCVPVTRDNGALPETNSWGILLSNDSKAEKWVSACLDGMRYGTMKRQRMADDVQKLTWGNVTLRMMERAFERTKILMEMEQQSEAAMQVMTGATGFGLMPIEENTAAR